MPPDNTKAALAGAAHGVQNNGQTVNQHAKADAKASQTGRRNRTRQRAVAAGICVPAVAPATRRGGAAAGAESAVAEPMNAFPLPIAQSARSAWVEWLAPRFTGNDSCYFTGTYSDDYGYANGLTLPRNVHKDFRRMLNELGLDGDFITGVEQHRYRDVLHLHAILQGPWTPEQMDFLKRWWQLDRGYARALPVLDGCASYVTKYALKGDTESFDWHLS